MQITLIRERGELEAIASEWNLLLSSSRADHAFLSWEFISTWLDVLRPACALRVITVRDPGGRLVGIAPLYLSRLRLAGTVSYRCLRVLGDEAGAADYPDLIVEAGREAEVLQALTSYLDELPGWDCLWMPRMSGWSGAPQRLEALTRAGDFHMRCRARPFSFIRLPGTFEAYLQTLSSKTRYNLRRGRRQCEDAGGAAIRLCERPEDVAGMIGHLQRLHQKHWEAAGEPGTFRRNPGQRAFFERLSLRFLERGWLRLACLEVQDRVAAVQFGYACNGVYSAVQEGYDPDLTQVSCGAGNVLRAATIESAIAEGMHTYDFLDGDTWHKQRWGADTREGYDVFVQRPSIRTWPLRLREFWPTGRYLSWKPVAGRSKTAAR